MSEVRIRAADLDDCVALCELYHAFHEFHFRGVPGRLRSLGEPEQWDRSGLVDDLAKIIRDENAALFVADAGEQLVGMAEVYLRHDEPHPLKVAHDHGYLQSLVVLEPFRHSGIGTQLLDAAQAWAKTKGASEMQLQIWEFPAGPLRFYEEAGYRTMRRTLVRDL